MNMSRSVRTEKPARVRIEYAYDDESRTWHFVVPALGVVGGGDASELELLDHARSAIRFALTDENTPDENDEPPGVRHIAISF
jgi:hypothetical protein